MPRRAIPWAFNGAPWVSAVAALMILLYIPMGSLPPILSASGDLILILYLLGLSAVAMAVGGFASGSTYANVGAQREMTLMMSYELNSWRWSSSRWPGLPTGRACRGEPFSLETFVGCPSGASWAGRGSSAWSVSCGLMAVVPAEVGRCPWT